MPYLTNIGTRGRIRIENKSGVGSRGYHIFRINNVVVCRWGGVQVKPGRTIVWSGRPQEKKYRHRNDVAAKLFVEKRLKKLQLPHEGYDKLPVGQKIW